MKFLETYSDEQAMTLSELELSRRLVAFTKLTLAYKDHYIMYLVIDASSWNNHFRRETVDDLMVNTLDKVFDTSVFGKTHMAFQNTLVYVPDEELFMAWDGQDGGIEGLNQDTWVITYLAQIKTALEPLNLKYHALCKGDDLRIAIYVPKHAMDESQLPKLKNDIMSKVSDTAKSLGHKIKIEESFGSLRYFAFSKETSVGGIMLPQTFRKIQKVHGYNNAFLPYIDDMIASTYSNAHSSCKVSSGVLAPETAGLYWCFYYMTQHPCYNYLSHDEFLALSLVPSLAGGFPIIYHHNMYVRAESDLLSPFIGLIQYLDKWSPSIAEHMRRFCILPTSPPRNLERVYKDPYAIGTLMPMLPTSMLRTYIEPMLVKITKNEDIKNLMRAAKSVSSKEFIECLDSSNILPARVFSALYAASPKGVLSELLAKFETARSLLQVLILGSNPQNARRILRRLLKQDLKLQTWRRDVIKGRVKGLSYSYMIRQNVCPSSVANAVRELSWGKPVETVTMPPLQHQIYIMSPEQGAYDMHAVEAHFTFHISPSKDTVCKDYRPHYSVGDYNPFIGYTTRTGTIEPSMSFVEKDVLLTKLRNIIELASWTNKQGTDLRTGNYLTSNLYILINTLVKQYTDTPLSTFAPFVGQRRSGTVQHHVRCPGYRESIVPNTLLNTYSHVQGESDTNIFVNKVSGAHYKINFLHIYCHSVAVYFSPWELFRTPLSAKEFWSVNTKCETCLEPISETPIIINEQIAKRIDFEGLKITKLHEDAMEVIALSLDAHKDRQFLAPSDEFELSTTAATEGVMQELVETLYRSRQALITRYTQHNLTNEGRQVLSSFAVKDKRREIGWTEIKRLNTEITTESLMNIIYYMIYKHISWDGSTELSTHLSLIPPQELPWYELVTALINGGKMPDIARCLAKRLQFPLSATMTSPENCSLVLGYHAVVNQDYCLRDVPIVILTNYDMTQINNHVSRQIISRARHQFSLEFKKFMPKIPERPTIIETSGEDTRRASYNDSYMKIIIASIMFWQIPLAQSDLIIVDHENIGEKTWNITQIVKFDMDDITAELMNLSTHTRDEILTNNSKYILRKYKVDIDVFTEKLDEFNVGCIDFLKPILERFNIRIILTTLSDCVGRVREITLTADSPGPSDMYRPRSQFLPFDPKPMKTCNRTLRFPILDHEGWISQNLPRTWPQFEQLLEPLRHIEYMSRPYGVANCSISTVTDLST